MCDVLNGAEGGENGAHPADGSRCARCGGNLASNKILILLALLGAVATASGQLANTPTKTWSHGNPSNDEQYALEVINRVRKDPVAAAELYITQAENGATALKATIDPLTWRTLKGAAALRERTRELLSTYVQNDPTRSLPPKGPLAFYPAFSAQAAARANENLTKVDGTFFNGVSANNQNFYGVGSLPYPAAVTGPNATGGTARTKAGGTQPNNAAEFLYFGSASLSANLPAGYSMREVYAITQGVNLYLDDVFTRTMIGTFGTITSDTRGKTRMIGISISDVRTAAPGLGNRVLTTYATDNEAFATSDLPYGSGNTVFVTGVVYEDKNKDGDYSPGEGIAGVTVTPNTGDWYAVTSASGGYAIPVSKTAGAVTVTFKGGAVDASNVVTINGDNVKLDSVYVNTTKPGQVLVAASDGTSKFVNLSTRGIAGEGADGMFGGFVITGTGTKKVLIRAVSKGLVNFGLTSLLRKPVATLYDANSKPIKTARTQDTYDNLAVGGPVKTELANIAASVGAFALPTSTSYGTPNLGVGGVYEPDGDVVMVVDLAPGLYSVGITPDVDTFISKRDQDGNPVGDDLDRQGVTVAKNGIVLMEIYDAGDTGGSSRFINLSTRGKIETGARQMFVGFVLSGNGNRRVLVRGVGPALKGFGLATALDDSAVTLYDSNSKPILDNDDWAKATWSDQTVDVGASVGAFAIPASSPDGIILTRLPAPGLYSVAIRSSTGTPGVGLAEIYETP